MGRLGGARSVTGADSTDAVGERRITVSNRPFADWDAFVAQDPEASLYHLSGWPEIAREVFGHQPLYLEARETSGALVGVLPVIQQKSRLLGNFATSLAFFNYGGALARDAETAERLMHSAAEVAQGRGCRYLEFRDIHARSGPWAQRTDKITLQLELPATFEALSKRLGAKLRSQVKRADREDVQCRTGGAELLDDFYGVFAENMRDLGTPVYPKRFFEAIVKRFESYCQMVVIDWQGEPAAAAFLTFWRNQAEVPWASCRARAKPLGLNMKLYWELLSLAVSRGCSVFDFGRSTIDSGTYRFKRQWGAEPKPLYWYRWERHPSGQAIEHGEGQGKVMQLATSVWQRLPLGVANALGPHISGALPW